MWRCPECGGEVVKIEKGKDLGTGEEVWIINNSVYLCLDCLSVFEDRDYLEWVEE